MFCAVVRRSVSEEVAGQVDSLEEDGEEGERNLKALESIGVGIKVDIGW